MDLKNLFPSLREALKNLGPAMYPDNKTPKARNSPAGRRGKTRKGATHKKGQVFLGHSLIPGITPAMYRRFHMGKKEVKNGS